MNNGYFITGTDTGVGKTYVTCALLRALLARGLKAAAMKPVAAGVMENAEAAGMNEDVAAIMRLTDNRYARADVNPYCFDEAIAPHIAAAHQGAVADPAVIAAAFARLQAQADAVLVEGAGGFMVPLSDAVSMADLPALLKLDVILVVGMRLGCLNHALLTTEAIAARGLRLAGWVANTPGETMPAFAENLATLQSRLAAPCLGVIPHSIANHAAQFDRAAIDILFPTRSLS